MTKKAPKQADQAHDSIQRARQVHETTETPVVAGRASRNIAQLQRTFGNQAVERMARAGALQRKTDQDASPPPQSHQSSASNLPQHIKNGVEQLSGISMDDVAVHYNSGKPANIGALAYAQGNEIHVGPNQEQHLPHEAWHVVQQKQGRVQSTLQMNGQQVNDEQGLEDEADKMGQQALNQHGNAQAVQMVASSQPVVQAVGGDEEDAQALEEEEQLPSIPQEVLEQWEELEDSEAFVYPKKDPELACWNWALTAMQGGGVTPYTVFEFIHGDKSAFAKLREAYTSDQVRRLARIRQLMDEKQLAVNAENGFRIPKNTKKNRENARALITETIRIIVEAQGFTIVDDSNTEIVMQYKISDGVSWEHWWIEVNGIVLETFPSMSNVQVTRDRQHADDEDYDLVRVPVAHLKPEHIAFFEED